MGFGYDRELPYVVISSHGLAQLFMVEANKLKGNYIKMTSGPLGAAGVSPAQFAFQFLGSLYYTLRCVPGYG